MTIRIFVQIRMFAITPMKLKEIQELKNKPEAELRKILSDSRTKLRQLKFDLAAGKVKNVSELHHVRKTIARVLTFLKQSEKSELHPNTPK